MTIEMMIYLADTAQALKIIEVIALLGAILAVCICVFIYFATYDGDEPSQTRAQKLLQKFSVYFAISAAFFILTPSSTTIYMIAGASAAKEIAKSEIGEKVYKLINKKLDELNEDKK